MAFRQIPSNACAQAVEIKIVQADGRHIRADYTTLPGNNPQGNNNYLALWEAKSQDITWADTPMVTVPANKTTNHGTTEFSGLKLRNNTPYIIGYSVVPENKASLKNNFCAMTYIKSLAEYKDYISKKAELKITEIDPEGTYIRVQYTLLKNYNPRSNNNWIGVWLKNDDYRTEEPEATIKIEDSHDTSSISLDFTIVSGEEYQVLYFAGGWNEDSSKLDRLRAISSIDFSAEDI